MATVNQILDKALEIPAKHRTKQVKSIIKQLRKYRLKFMQNGGLIPISNSDEVISIIDKNIEQWNHKSKELKERSKTEKSLPA